MNRLSSRSSWGIVAVVAVAAGLGLAGAAVPRAAVGRSAQGSTASVSGGVLQIQGGPGVNNISLSLLGDPVDTSGMLAGPGCTQFSETRASCPGYTRIVAHLGAGDDVFAAGMAGPGVSATVYGEDGDDTIDTTDGNDTVYGGAGDDQISASGGNDTVDGGAGNDTIMGGGDSDTIVGGPGRDAIRGDGYVYYEGGNDTIDVRDGEPDQVECGYGADVVKADAADDVATGECENVQRGTSGAAVADRKAPVVHAYASSGVHGQVAKLYYSVSDNSGVTREKVLVVRGSTSLRLIGTTFGASNGGRYFVRWRVPAQTAGDLRFCVRSWDRAGNASAISCAALRIE